MNNPREFTLTSTQLAKACGISRATVLRLEKRGLIKPIDREAENTTRHYDISALYQTNALLMLQELGFDNQTIQDFIENNSNYNVIKYALNKRISEAINLLDSLSNYTDLTNHLKISDSDRNGFIAYAEEVKFDGDWEAAKDLFLVPLNNAIRRGYELDMNTPTALVIPDKYIANPKDPDATAKIFIPINPVTVRLTESKKIVYINGEIDLPREPLIVSMENANYTSITWHGDFKGFDHAFEVLNQHLEENNIETYDYSHIAFYHGEFFGKEIPKERNFVRVFKKHK